jgi:hypothetical protein
MLMGVVALLAAAVGRVVIRSQAGFLLSRPTAVEWLGVIGIAVGTSFLIVKTRFYTQWTFWRTRQPEARATTLLGAIIAVALLVEAFAALTSPLMQLSLVQVSGFTPNSSYSNPAGGGSGGMYLLSGDPDVYQAMERLFVCNFLDAIPALKVPETLNWDRPAHEFRDPAGGAILLVFKILVILPVINLLVQLFKRPEGPHAGTELAEPTPQRGDSGVP